MIAILSLFLAAAQSPDGTRPPVPLSEPLAFEAGADLHQILSAFAAGSGSYLGRASKDELRRHRLTAALELTPDNAALEIERLCHEAGQALWPEVFGPWRVLRSLPFERVSLAHARFVPAEDLEPFAQRPALPISTVLSLSSLRDVRRARTMDLPAGVQALRPGAGRVGWNGLVLWGPAPQVIAGVRAFRGEAIPPTNTSAPRRIETVKIKPTFGVEDERRHLRRDDGELSRRIRLGEGGRFLLEDSLASVEELMRAYELATWRTVTYRGGYAQRARYLSVPPFPRPSLTADELEQWVQAVLALHGLVGRPGERGALVVEPIGRYSRAPDRTRGPKSPESLDERTSPTIARFVLFATRDVAAATDLADHIESGMRGLSFGRCERQDWGVGLYILGPERGARQAAAVVGALMEQTQRGPAVVALKVRGDPQRLAANLMGKLHPGRDLEELALLPWFGEPLIAVEAEHRILVLADADGLGLILDEVKTLDQLP
jgi:hypothetical protein